VRKRISIILGLALTAIMAYGVVGSGASFTDTGAVYQDVTFGAMQLRISSTTEGAVISGDGKTLVCPDLEVTNSDLSFYPSACKFRIESVGGVVARLITVHATTSSSDGLENSKIILATLNDSTRHLNPPMSDYLLITSAERSPIEDGVFFMFSDLTNASAGGSLSLVLTINAVE
jgi:hypothetical protein